MCSVSSCRAASSSTKWGKETSSSGSPPPSMMVAESLSRSGNRVHMRDDSFELAVSPLTGGEEQFSLDRFPLDQADIAPSVLNIEAKERSNFFPWNGQFSPQFVEAILSNYARRGQTVYDPFCGSGTVLGEAGRIGINAVGSELNPAAFLLSRVYTLMAVPYADRASLVGRLEASVAQITSGDGPSLAPSEDLDVSKGLVSLTKRCRGHARILFEALVILSDFYKGATPVRVWRTWLKLKSVVLRLPFSSAEINVQLRDCRADNVSSAPVDIVLTSPPYINVYNYHQQYRASAEALGWNLLEVARSEFGSNRKHRGNRFLTVTQYCLDMAETLGALGGCLANNGRIVIVVGRESKVRGISFLNGELVARLAVEIHSHRLLLRQERVFTNRFGQRIFEDILHLRPATPGHRTIDSGSGARRIAAEALRGALRTTSTPDVQDDLEAAIASVTSVKGSPHFGALTNHQVKVSA